VLTPVRTPTPGDPGEGLADGDTLVDADGLARLGVAVVDGLTVPDNEGSNGAGKGAQEETEFEGDGGRSSVGMGPRGEGGVEVWAAVWAARTAKRARGKVARIVGCRGRRGVRWRDSFLVLERREAREAVGWEVVGLLFRLCVAMEEVWIWSRETNRGSAVKMLS
jgi:hypothetical protein